MVYIFNKLPMPTSHLSILSRGCNSGAAHIKGMLMLEHSTVRFSILTSARSRSLALCLIQADQTEISMYGDIDSLSIGVAWQWRVLNGAASAGLFSMWFASL